MSEALHGPFHRGPVRWLATAEANGQLEGFKSVPWDPFVTGWIAAARDVGMERASLDSAARGWLDWLDRVDRLAVTGVSLGSLQAVVDLQGFVVEPATRRGMELVIVADRALDDLDPADFMEPEFGYAYTLERLRWRVAGVRPQPGPPAQLIDTDVTPVGPQQEAVEAQDGVVQIIAPAGSGKTTVLIERVRELRRRGVPPKAIACVTFNASARDELRERLQRGGVGNVQAFTFHSLGRRILIDAGKLPPRPKVGRPTQGQLRLFAVQGARRAECPDVFLDAAEVNRELSDIKLGLLMTPAEYAAYVEESPDPVDRVMAEVYKLYEDHQRRRRQIDFDDMVLQAALLLRHDVQVRKHWQQALQHLLVDEYQDIEPAQELIVRLVAAPHDQLFCVGDEDQTLYAFRRASVERIICLDGLYPGLERVALQTNYRCAPKIVALSKQLIDRNSVRFPKAIEPGPDRQDTGIIELQPVTHAVEAAGVIARLLKTKQRGDITVLARVTDALRPVALACADAGVKIDGNDKLFEPTGARAALQDHLRLVLHPEAADADLVKRVCQVPNRHLNWRTESRVVRRLQEGATFEQAFEGLPEPARGRGSLLAAGDLFTQLAGLTDDAAKAVALLRGPGGLDPWFEENDRMGGLEQFEAEVLEHAQVEAAGRSLADYLDELDRQAAALKAIRDRRHGIELLTIHGSKGREWPHVILVACNENILPHGKSLQVTPEETARGEGIEAERRLGYVAFTRARQRLEIHYDPEAPSSFLGEVGLVAMPQRVQRAARLAPPIPLPPGMS